MQKYDQGGRLSIFSTLSRAPRISLLFYGVLLVRFSVLSLILLSHLCSFTASPLHIFQCSLSCSKPRSPYGKVFHAVLCIQTSASSPPDREDLSGREEEIGMSESLIPPNKHSPQLKIQGTRYAFGRRRKRDIIPRAECGSADSQYTTYSYLENPFMGSVSLLLL
jgi:hypothetical protein